MGLGESKRTEQQIVMILVYPQAIEHVFGAEVDFGQLLKLYRSVRQPDGGWEKVVYTSRGRPMVGRPEPESVSTRMSSGKNLNFRMGSKRFTRKTNAFSKLTARHRDAVTLFCTYHNFCSGASDARHHASGGQRSCQGSPSGRVAGATDRSPHPATNATGAG